MGKVAPFEKSLNEVLSYPTISDKTEGVERLPVKPFAIDPERRRDLQSKSVTAKLYLTPEKFIESQASSSLHPASPSPAKKGRVVIIPRPLINLRYYLVSN